MSETTSGGEFMRTRDQAITAFSKLQAAREALELATQEYDEAHTALRGLFPVRGERIIYTGRARGNNEWVSSRDKIDPGITSTGQMYHGRTLRIDYIAFPEDPAQSPVVNATDRLDADRSLQIALDHGEWSKVIPEPKN
jgi:hypothetical protein